MFEAILFRGYAGVVGRVSPFFLVVGSLSLACRLSWVINVKGRRVECRIRMFCLGLLTLCLLLF